MSGIDVGNLLYSGDMFSAQMVHVFANGHTSGSQGENFSGNQTGSQNFQDATLLKFDLRGKSWQTSLNFAKKYVDPLFIGAFAQWTANDAWLLYGEIGSGSRPTVLNPNNYNSFAPSPRAMTGLLGSFTRWKIGQTIYTEFLYDGHGYTHHQETSYFATAQQLLNQRNSNPYATEIIGLGFIMHPYCLAVAMLLLSGKVIRKTVKCSGGA